MNGKSYITILSELAFSGKTNTPEYESILRRYRETDNGRVPTRRFTDEYWNYLEKNGPVPNKPINKMIYYVENNPQKAVNFDGCCVHLPSEAN